ncbi:MAG: DUF1810 domain-containing protein [Verrucomicrobiota bacterium JB022]|nr:DUF1810 domain-containing protein [Verrucomicrobiota bacterium JB022]
MPGSDPFQHFIDAQESVYPQVVRELQAGRKRSHWMWFIFPQLQGLGSSSMARRYALASRAEAEAYAAHPVLGPRLREGVALVLAVEGRTAHEIFGSPDDLKFRSCLTLFEAACPREPLFARGLERYYGGERDPSTQRLLAD